MFEFDVLVEGKVIYPSSEKTLDAHFNGNGDVPPFSNGPDREEIHGQGNRYIRTLFPEMDFIHECHIVQEIPLTRKEDYGKLKLANSQETIREASLASDSSHKYGNKDSLSWFNNKVNKGNVTENSFPPIQLEALESLYNSTNGIDWDWKRPYEEYGYPWNFSHPYPNPCTERWQGVTCSSDCPAQCDLISLSLPIYGLEGTIPSELGSLTNLQELSLNNNSLSGSIPSELGALTYLQHLSLNNNALSGSIPSELGALTYLQYLSLNNNAL